LKILNFSFIFKIDLHRDDISVLEYICNRLKIGKVSLLNTKDKHNNSGTVVRWNIVTIMDIERLIKIIDNRYLNTSKHLDYLKWKQAFYIKKESKYAKIDTKKENKLQILNLKLSMNKNKTSFFPIANHNIIITPYWFLGFLEGDGCFMVKSRHYQNIFAIELTISEKPVLIALSDFIKELIPNYLLNLKNRSTIIGLSDVPSRSLTRKPKVKLSFSYFQLICEIIIPFFDKLTFFTTKELDYKDWKIVGLIKKAGLHHTDEGKILIDSICNRMNINRLSTKK
jgi:hypothetical protein